MEADLAAKFKVSRSPVREALQALESEGTLLAAPYTGALVRPLSPTEAREIAEIRLALISLAVKRAHPHLAPARFNVAYDLAKRRVQMVYNLLPKSTIYLQFVCNRPASVQLPQCALGIGV